MRIINGSSFSIPTTVSKSRNNGNLFQALNKNVDPLKTNDGHTDPVGAAKQRLAQAMVNGQAGISRRTNVQAGYHKGSLGKSSRFNLKSVFARLQNIFQGALKR